MKIISQLFKLTLTQLMYTMTTRQSQRLAQPIHITKVSNQVECPSHQRPNALTRPHLALNRGIIPLGNVHLP